MVQRKEIHVIMLYLALFHGKRMHVNSARPGHVVVVGAPCHVLHLHHCMAHSSLHCMLECYDS